MSVRSVIAAAHREQAVEADRSLVSACARWRTDPGPAAQAADSFVVCEYWLELGFGSLAAYSLDRVGSRSLIRGLAYYHRLIDIIPHCRGLWRARLITPAKLAAVGRYVTPTTAVWWLPLIVNLRPHDLRAAAKEYSDFRRGSPGQPCYFVPLLIPRPWYHRVWRPRDHGQSAFQLLQDLLKEASSHE